MHDGYMMDSTDNNKLIVENCLLPTDPQRRLRGALYDNDLITFKKLVNSAAVDLEYVYQYPDYKTCLEIAICETNDNHHKKNSLKHFLKRKKSVGDNESFSEAFKVIKKLNFIKFLLQQKVEINKLNEMYAAAPIHFAVESGNIGALEVLLADDRIDVNIKSRGKTALLLAIETFFDLDDDLETQSTVYKHMIEMLLKAGCNVNSPGIKGTTPVFIAAKNGDEEIVRLLLDYAHDLIDIDSYKDRHRKSARHYLKETFPHLEIQFNSKAYTTHNKDEIMLFTHINSCDESQFIREFEKLVKKNEHEPKLKANNGTHTMLQLATAKGMEKAVEILLKSGADPNATCTEGIDRAVTIACRNGNVNILQIFIEHGTTSFQPENGESLLQITIKGMKCPRIEHTCNYADCINTLLTNPKIKPPININHSDFKHNTALHYAARNGDQNIVLELLRKGASVGVKNRFDDLPLADINAKTFETYLDECVTDNSGRLSDHDYEIRFKYSFLVNPHICSKKKECTPLLQENTRKPNGSILAPEMDALVYMSQNEQLLPLLKHPVITSFLYLKWQRINCLFIVNLTFYTIFWLNLMLYIILENLIEKDQVNSFEALNVITHTASCFGAIFILCRELFQLPFSIKIHYYFQNPKNLLDISLIVITVWYLFYDTSTESTKRQLSAIIILLSSAELLLLIGHFPTLSTYIVMLKTVCTSFFKFFLSYCILLLAFAVSFYVLFKNMGSDKGQQSTNSNNTVEDDFFEDPGRSLFKTIVMLTGEFDTGSIKFKIFPVTSHIIFIVFIFIVPIVLFNLLSGLAVSDTQQIRANAELVGHVSTVKLVSYIETIFLRKLYSNFKIWTYLPSSLKKLMIFKPKTLCIKPFAKRICLFPDVLPLYSIAVKPNRDNSIEIPQQKMDGDHEDIESGKCCLNIWPSYKLNPNTVKDAKILLYKKSQGSELDEIKSKLSEILQILKSRKNAVQIHH